MFTATTPSPTYFAPKLAQTKTTKHLPGRAIAHYGDSQFDLSPLVEAQQPVILVLVSGGAGEVVMPKIEVGAKHWLLENISSESYEGALSNKDLFVNWIAFMEKHSLKRHIGLVCIDRESAKFVSAAGYSCNVRTTLAVKEEGSLWVFRAYIVSFLVRNLGLSVLVSDLDAVWVQNPLKYLSSIDADVIALRGIGAVRGAKSRANAGESVSRVHRTGTIMYAIKRCAATGVAAIYPG
jgi:hypothetical protein